MKFWVLILLWGTAFATAKALKCYVCESKTDENCVDIPEGQTQHLAECPEKMPYCTLSELEDQEKLGNIFQSRYCASRYECYFFMERPRCCRCHTNACNRGTYCVYEDSEACAMSIDTALFVAVLVGGIVV